MGFLDGDTAQHLIAHYGYAAIFLVVMMESTGIPMPGETILISAAALAGTKHALDIRGIIAAAAGGAIVGDNIGFWVGREFGEPLLEKWGYLVGLDARKRLLGRYLFARYGGSIVFFGRFVALLRAFAAGTLAVLRLQCVGGHRLGYGFWVGRLPARRGHTSHRRTRGLGDADIGTCSAAALVWRYFKDHEERLLAAAEFEKAKYDRR
jgi:membrane protein YqaA with SNARE-associated domain